ncbi:MAG: hypothetical protein JW751_03210 [Polyangiaceae bacterium]|nr:hypothetical protein [Polyangiaceae bacterium]
MERMRCLGCWVSVVAVLVGCASARRAEPPPREADVATVAGGDDAESGKPDLSPVTAPGEVVVVGRWQAPLESVDLLLGWTRLPVDWRGLVDQAVPRTSQGPGREVLALDAPVDLVVMLPRAGKAPEPRVAFSVGLTSLDGALELAEALHEDIETVRPYYYRVGGRHDLTCMLGPSVGRAPARAVCGDGFADVEELMPYMTRGLPNERVGDADVYLEVRGEPIRRAYGPALGQAEQLVMPFLIREFALDDPRLDRAIADGARSLLGEGIALIDDADRLSLSIDLDAATGLAKTSFVMDFRGTKSWTATTMAEAATRAIAAPELFWDLPYDAPSASFGAPGNPERASAIRVWAREVLDAFLAYGKAPATFRKEVSQLVDQTHTTPTTRVSIQGPAKDVPAPPAATATGFSISPILSALDRLGWQLHGYEIPAKEYIDYFDAFVRLYRNPALVKLLQAKVPDLDRARMPTLDGRPAGTGFPFGSRRYEMTLKETVEGSAKPRTRSLFLVVVPDGDHRSWIAFGNDLGVLREQTAKVLKPGPKTLRDRPGLEALRGEPLTSGGFTTLRSTFESSLRAYLGMKGPEWERTLNAMPAHGETPMPVTLRISQGKSPRLEWTMVTPNVVVQDLAAAMPAIMANSLFSGED